MGQAIETEFVFDGRYRIYSIKGWGRAKSTDH